MAFIITLRIQSIGLGLWVNLFWFSIVYKFEQLQQIDLILKMKTQFSFKENSRCTTDFDAINSHSVYFQDYNTIQSSKNNWTDFRIEQIKRKYDTPFIHQNITSKEQNDYQPNRNSLKSNNIRQPLKQSATFNSNIPFHNRERKSSNQQSKSKLIRANISEDITFSKKILKIKDSGIDSKKKSSFNAKQQPDTNKYYLPFKQSHNKEFLDPRLKNIDQINNKIKHILDSLHQNSIQYLNPKKNESFSKKSFEAKEINPKNNHSLAQQTKIIGIQNFKNNSKEQSQVIENNSNEQHFQNNQKQPNIKKEKLITHRRVDSQSQWKQHFLKEEKQAKLKKIKQNHTRVKSCLQGFTQIAKRQNSKDSNFNDSNHFQNQIENIQARIKRFEDQKKKLNIQFKPFTYKMHNRSYSNFLQIQNQIQPQIKNDIISYRYQQVIQQSNQRDNSQTDINKTSHNPNKIQNQRNKTKAEQTYDQSNGLSFQNSKFCGSSLEEQNSFNELDNQVLRKKASQGIQHRKKILNSLNCFKKKCQQIEKLVKALGQQVILDQQLRNSKIWLQNCFLGNKYEAIIKQLRKYNTTLTTEQIDAEFKLTEEENNPFYSLRENTSDIETVVNNYENAKRHWKQKILGKFNKEKLDQENLRQGKIDLQKKGYVSLRDLVRLLNMEGGKFFRNRDVVLIWRRITEHERITLQKFYQIIS